MKPDGSVLHCSWHDGGDMFINRVSKLPGRPPVSRHEKSGESIMMLAGFDIANRKTQLMLALIVAGVIVIAASHGKVGD